MSTTPSVIQGSGYQQESRVERRTRDFGRWLLWALPVWAAMLFLGTLTKQPDPQTEFPAFAAYVTTPMFLVSHLVNSILGAAVGSIGVIGLLLYLLDTRAAGRALAGMVATVAGNTLTASVFGAAAFAQPAIGRAFLSGDQNALALYNDVYSAPLFGTVSLGLLLFLVGGVLVGLAIAASGRLPRWAGWVYAIAVVVFAFGSLALALAANVGSAALFVATVVVAWVGSRRTALAKT